MQISVKVHMFWNTTFNIDKIVLINLFKFKFFDLRVVISDTDML